MYNSFIFDDYKIVEACYGSASGTRELILKGRAVAYPLSLKNGTMFHISFVPLSNAVLEGTPYDDGSNKGVQINIHGMGSYSLPFWSTIGEPTYIMEKWHVSFGDAEVLLPYFNSILTGKDYFYEVN